MQNVNTYPDGYCNQQNPYPNDADQINRQQYRCPKRNQYIGFYFFRNGFMLHEIGDVRSQNLMSKQFVIESSVASQKTKRRQQQKRSRRQNRNEHSQNTQPQRYESEYRKQ